MSLDIYQTKMYLERSIGKTIPCFLIILLSINSTRSDQCSAFIDTPCIEISDEHCTEVCESNTTHCLVVARTAEYEPKSCTAFCTFYNLTCVGSYDNVRRLCTRDYEDFCSGQSDFADNCDCQHMGQVCGCEYA